MTHTPGPWSVVKSITRPICYIQSREGQVATTYGEQDFYNHQLPNANLIAASPDLLDALEELVDLVEAVREGEYEIDYFTTQPGKHAIAKAKGQPKKEVDK